VFPVRYELDFYISENDILHSHRRESTRSYTTIISLSTTDRYSVFHVVRTSSLALFVVHDIMGKRCEEEWAFPQKHFARSLIEILTKSVCVSS
jgi:hypothetical protein